MTSGQSPDGISRRRVLQGLSALPLASAAAESVKPPPAGGGAGGSRAEAPASTPSPREVQGTGGRLFVEQLKAAEVEYLFFNPATGDAAIYDALVDAPEITLIKGLQEGAVIAMADGYARASGKTGVAIVADVGLPNAMTQMVNTYKDRIPLLLTMAAEGQNALAGGSIAEYDHQENMLIPITKWAWKAGEAAGIPETTRQALKLAATPPAGPVFLALPQESLRAQAAAQVSGRASFEVPMRTRPDRTAVEMIARMLIEAQNPLLTVGDEVTLSGGQREVLRLAELLGLPVMGEATYGQWSSPFPTRHPLFIGMTQANVPALGQIDVHLNIGSQAGEVAARGARLVSIRSDPASLGQAIPLILGVVADPKLATADLVDAVGSLATKSRLARIAQARSARVAAYTLKAREERLALARSFAGGPKIRLERLAFELESFLDRDTLYVADVDSGRNMNPLMSFGGDDKTYIGTGPAAMGWGMAAALGVKLARPDAPVISVVGDGSFLFSGPQPLWSISRYEAPITIVVLNNRSYNNERNRIWAFDGGAQLQKGLDMTCYNGSPNVDFTTAARAFGVDGESVTEPQSIKPALIRAKRANVEGRAYLLEILIERDGVGAASEWYPQFSIASLRTRKV